MSSTLLGSFNCMGGPHSPVVLPGRWVPLAADAALAERIRAAFLTPLRARGVDPYRAGVVAAPEPLFDEVEIGGQPVLRVPAGLAPAVRLVDLMATTARSAPRLTGAPAATSNKPSVGFTPFIASQAHGLIRYHPRRVDPARLVLDIAHAFPKAAITVLVAHKSDAVGLAGYLRRHGVDAYGYVGSGTPYVADRPLEARVAVATMAGMAGNSTEVEKQDLILALDAVEAAGRATRQVLLSHTTLTTKLFGLVPLDDPPAGADEDWVHALFGFKSHDVLFPGSSTRQVEVTSVAASGRRLTRGTASDLELRRYGVWTNDARNRQVARVALAVAARDVQALRRLGIGVQHLPGAGRVVGLVENLEHALNLLPKLDGWALAAAPYPHTAGLDDEERLLLTTRRRIDPTSAPGLVATPAGLAAAAGYVTGFKPIAGWAAVVRADASDGLPPIPADELAGAADPLLVIDLADDHHPALEALAYERRRAYVAAGWWVDGVDPAWARAAEFLRRRAHLLHTPV